MIALKKNLGIKLTKEAKELTDSYWKKLKTPVSTKTFHTDGLED